MADADYQIVHDGKPRAAWCKKALPRRDNRVTEAVLQARHWAIVACCVQFVFGIVSLSVSFDEEVPAGMVFSPVFAILAGVGLAGAVYVNLLLVLGHFVIVFGCVAVGFAYCLVEYFALHDDDSDRLLLVSGIPLLFDVMFAACSARLYILYYRTPSSRRTALMSAASSVLSTRSPIPSEGRPSICSPVMPSRIRVTSFSSGAGKERRSSSIWETA